MASKTPAGPGGADRANGKGEFFGHDKVEVVWPPDADGR
jgi:hypothetical protein